MRKITIDKKKGILFWVTGLSGSGKTTISQLIKKEIIKTYGPTILVSGDNLRRIFDFKGYRKKERLNLSRKFCKFAKFVTDQKINLIFAIVGLMNEPRNWNRKNIKNYVEIYIKSDLKKIISRKAKKIYHRKRKEKIVGLSIRPEFPKNPHITIINNFKYDTKHLSAKLIKEIKKKIN